MTLRPSDAHGVAGVLHQWPQDREVGAVLAVQRFGEQSGHDAVLMASEKSYMSNLSATVDAGAGPKSRSEASKCLSQCT